MTRPNARLEPALRYAARGWPVFPLQPGTKVPLPRSHGLLEATTDERQIVRWWDRHPERNIAIATGQPGPDCLDVDVAHGKPGPASLNRLIRAQLIGRPQVVVRTPSGGSHLIYRGSEQRNGSLPEHGLDYRGRGGYIVAVPSAVGDRSYQAIYSERSSDTCDWQAIKTYLEPERQNRPAWQPREGRQADVSHLADWMAARPEGHRNDELFWALNRAREVGDVATVDRLAAAARSAGLTEREIRATMRSAERTTPLPFIIRTLGRSERRPADMSAYRVGVPAVEPTVTGTARLLRRVAARGPEGGRMSWRKRLDIACLSLVKAGTRAGQFAHRVAAQGLERSKLAGAQLARHIIAVQKAAGVTEKMMQEAEQ